MRTKLPKIKHCVAELRPRREGQQKIFTTKKTLAVLWSHFLHWQSFSRALKTLKKGEMEKTVGGVVVTRYIESVPKKNCTIIVGLTLDEVEFITWF